MPLFLRPYIQSFSFHIFLAGLLFILLHTSVLEVKETPIEIADIIQKVSDAVPTKPKTAPKNTSKTPARATLTPPTAGSSTNPVAPPASHSDAPPSDSNEPLAEEYEVAELPVLVQEVRVPYPPGAKSKGIQGVVVFDLVVGSNGSVTSAVPVKSAAPDLTEAALAAVKQFKFRPAHLNDKAVAIKIRYTYRFVLE